MQCLSIQVFVVIAVIVSLWLSKFRGLLLAVQESLLPHDMASKSGSSMVEKISRFGNSATSPRNQAIWGHASIRNTRCHIVSLVSHLLDQYLSNVLRKVCAA